MQYETILDVARLGGMAEWLCTWLLTRGLITDVGSIPTASTNAA